MDCSQGREKLSMKHFTCSDISLPPNGNRCKHVLPNWRTIVNEAYRLKRTLVNKTSHKTKNDHCFL